MVRTDGRSVGHLITHGAPLRALCAQELRYKPGINVAKYHLGKVKLERVGQWFSPTSVCDLRGGQRGIAGLLVCPFARVVLHCSFAY